MLARKPILKNVHDLEGEREDIRFPECCFPLPLHSRFDFGERENFLSQEYPGQEEGQEDGNDKEGERIGTSHGRLLAPCSLKGKRGDLPA
jgi:hypothetical protein